MLTYVAVDQISTCAAHTLKFFTATMPIFWITRSQWITWATHRHLRQKWPSSRSGLSLTFFLRSIQHAPLMSSLTDDWLTTTDLGWSGFLWLSSRQGKHFPSKYGLHHYMKGNRNTPPVWSCGVSTDLICWWLIANLLRVRLSSYRTGPTLLSACTTTKSNGPLETTRQEQTRPESPRMQSTVGWLVAHL